MTGAARRSVARVLALALTCVPAVANAALRDRGELDPATGYPLWYRDSRGVALKLCMSQLASPNVGAGGLPMCFPPIPVAAGFPGNWGAEAFFAASDARIQNGRIDALLVLSLEAAYVSATPVRGEEVVFTRYRVRISPPVPGTYTITHPFGSKVYRNVAAGNRTINDTIDLGFAQGLFDMALDGWIGPFIEWDTLDVDPAAVPPRKYTLTNAAGEQFLGDPNIPHRVKGSPFGTNYFRIDGPPGSNLDGFGNDFVQTDLFTVVGQRYLGPIKSMLQGDRAVFATDGTSMNIDVFSKAAPGSSLVVSGAGFPSSPMLPDGFGNYYAHISYLANGAPPPPFVVVTNFTDVPQSTKEIPVGDSILATAVYDSSSGVLDVQASSSDERNPSGPSLTAPGIAGAFNPAPGNPMLRTMTVLTDVPPSEVTVQSASGGSETVKTYVLAAPVPTSNPVAVPDDVITPEDTVAAIPVLANDVPTAATVMIQTQPVNGTAVVNGATGGVDYTPRPNWSGTDSFVYLIQDPVSGLLSNTATVNVAVTAVNDPPVANIDRASTSTGVAKVIPVLANDTDVDGTINPASVVITMIPANGSAVVNANGTITYTPNAGFAATDVFAYSVSDDLGAVSGETNNVVVNVTASAEILSVTRAQWTIAQRRWNVDGLSSVFGPNVANTVRIHNGPTTAYPVIGTATIGPTGAFAWAPAAGSTPAPDPTRRITIVSTGGGQISVTALFR